MKAMKHTLILLAFLFLAAAAFGQVGGSLSNQPYVLELPDHPQHASYAPLASEQPLVGGSCYSYEKGERPLWEFGPVSEAPSLGDVARAYRKEKQYAKKSGIVLEKQGS